MKSGFVAVSLLGSLMAGFGGLHNHSYSRRGVLVTALRKEGKSANTGLRESLLGTGILTES